ncbi:AraC family transcriptional regulator [Chryseobacterium sp. Leaf404]|uniref:hypothetical protein n=1 Tax=unclassified Chryseobacterium TaxID=2593645 RepID=UPI0006FCB9CD|nr:MULTISPECIES: hypothetical protein [unclassified Chryseobacterium]KQT17604.1 AraC family transcriptional regulator [Chryseobacterium sp. Leaf404]
MKYLLEFVLITIVLFFVWNILKKIFFNKFYKYTGFKPQERAPKQETKNANIEKKVKWDAETVEYEEVKESKDKR